MQKDNARRLIRDLVARDAAIILSRHAKQEVENDQLTVVDVLAVLKAGAVVASPIPNQLKNNWECEVRGTVPDGDRVCVVVAIDEKPSNIVVITAYRLG